MIKRVKNMLLSVREPANTYTHLAGFFLSIPALILLIHKAVLIGQATHVVAFSIFGSSMLLLYLASSLYHMLPVSDKGINILRKIDHIMIYVLIAGTYTPITVIVLHGLAGWILFSIIWAFVMAGIFIKLVWIHAPKWVSLMLYLIMGWIAVLFMPFLWKSLNTNALFWIFTGGITYSIGAVFYAIKWPNPSQKHFNFHAIWHLFVLGGSFCFFWLMYAHIVYLSPG